MVVCWIDCDFVGFVIVVVGFYCCGMYVIGVVCVCVGWMGDLV